MECQYYNPKMQVLLCRSRITEDWLVTKSLKEPFWRFYWHCDIPAVLKFKDDVYELGPDHFALVAPETDFKSQGGRVFEQFYVHFNAAHPYDSCLPGVYIYKITDSIRFRINTIKELLKSEEQKPSRKLSMLTRSLCCEALTFIPDKYFSEDYVNKKMIKSLEYIEAHYMEDISNALLASRVGMNVNAFARLFKFHTGVSPHQFIQNRRIREACILLRYTTLTIDEIALMTGFSDRYYFSRLFKKKRGVGPAGFRKQSD